MIVLALIIINCILCLNKRRVEDITDRYNEESALSQLIGKFLVILYVVLSSALIMLPL